MNTSHRNASRVSNIMLSAAANLPSLANECNYRTGELACKLGISNRSLQRFCKVRLRTTARALLRECRIVEIWRLAHLGLTGKGIAHSVSFASSQNLCRALKLETGRVLSLFKGGRPKR